MTTPQAPTVQQPGDDTWDNPGLPAERAVLEALQWHWGEVYHIGVDDGQWWFRRRDGKGGTETATTPDQLRTQMSIDYFTFPVNRDALPPISAQPQPASSHPAASDDAKAIQWT
jgi:hypothetical protein